MRVLFVLCKCVCQDVCVWGQVCVREREKIRESICIGIGYNWGGYLDYFFFNGYIRDLNFFMFVQDRVGI